MALNEICNELYINTISYVPNTSYWLTNEIVIGEGVLTIAWAIVYFANFPQECNRYCATAILDASDYFIQTNTDELRLVFTNEFGNFKSFEILHLPLACRTANILVGYPSLKSMRGTINRCVRAVYIRLQNSIIYHSYNLYFNSIMSSCFVFMLKWDVDCINNFG